MSSLVNKDRHFVRFLPPSDYHEHTKHVKENYQFACQPITRVTIRVILTCSSVFHEPSKHINAFVIFCVNIFTCAICLSEGKKIYLCDKVAALFYPFAISF